MLVAYLALSLRQHARHETTGYDLSIFAQGVQGYAHGHWPISHVRGINLLGDHFSPAMALLAPLYRLVPDPRTLLVAQAVLIALSVVPVTVLARDWFGPGTGWVIGLAYGMSWGVQQAVHFDVHEISLAVPLLSCCSVALARRRSGAAVCWALPLLLVKEDLPATVAVVGLLVAARGRHRAGVAVVLTALATACLVMFVVLPGFNPAGRYQYAGAVPSLGGAGWGAGASAKWHTVVWVLAPTAFLALRSPLVLLAVPTLAWRFLAQTPSYWGTTFHYSAVLMPVVFVAMLDGLHRLQGHLVDGGLSPRQVTAVRRAVLGGCVVVTVAIGLGQPLARLAHPAFWRTDPRVVGQSRALARVPDGAVVAASNGLSPQLVARADVWRYPVPPGAPEPDYIVVDVAGVAWRPGPETLADLGRRRAHGWSTVYDDGATVVLKHPGADVEP